MTTEIGFKNNLTQLIKKYENMKKFSDYIIDISSINSQTPLMKEITSIENFININKKILDVMNFNIDKIKINENKKVFNSINLKFPEYFKYLEDYLNNTKYENYEKQYAKYKNQYNKYKNTIYNKLIIYPNGSTETTTSSLMLFGKKRSKKRSKKRQLSRID